MSLQRKLLKHELEIKVTDLETELKKWKANYHRLNNQYDILEKQNSIIYAQTHWFQRLENKLQHIDNIISNDRYTTITGTIVALIERFIYCKPVLRCNESDSNESDSNESDSNESDSNESDSNESDSNEIDSNEIDSNEGNEPFIDVNL